jgi:hypothetical protein
MCGAYVKDAEVIIPTVLIDLPTYAFVSVVTAATLDNSKQKHLKGNNYSGHIQYVYA